MVRNEFFPSIFGESVTSSSASVFRQPTGRRQRILVIVQLCKLLAGLVPWLLHTEPGNAQTIGRFAPPQAADRIAIIAPHPDDEILGASGLIQQAVAAGAQVKIIYLTNGDHNQAAYRRFSQQHLAADPLALGEQRQTEAVAATKLLGLGPDDLVFLGYPDWWTLRLWQDYWDEDDVLYNNATGSTGVPYRKNYSYQHPYRAECVTDDLCAVLREFKPTRVFVSHPCDTNPDHRAAANFVRLALLQLESEQIRPALDFYIVHFGNWPTPLQYSPNLRLDPPATLRSDNDWESLPLTLEQVERKHRATLTNLTQIANGAPHFLEAFARANEVFATGREPLIPLVPVQAKLDWTKATHLRALPVLPSECGHDSSGIAALSAAESAMDLKCIDFIQQADELVVQVELKNLGHQRAGVRLYLFAFKQGVDFADLPKVQITISPTGRMVVLIDLEAIENSGVTMSNLDSHLILRVPLKLLGGPDIDHLFTTARAYLGAQIADDIAWHLLRFDVASKS